MKKRLKSKGGSVQDQHVDKEDAGYVGWSKVSDASKEKEEAVEDKS